MTPKRFTNTLLFRTFSFEFVLVLLSIAAVTAFSLFNVRLMLRRNAELRGRSLLAALSRDAELPLLLQNRAELEEIVARAVQADGVLAATIAPVGARPVQKARVAEVPTDEALTFEQPLRSDRAARLAAWMDHGAAPATLGSARVTLSLGEQKDFIRHTTLYSLSIGGLILILACILQYYRLRRVLRPLERLVEAAGRIEAGEMVQAQRCDSVFEYGRLTDAFNRMVSSLKATLERLRESEERYGLAVDGSNDGIWDLDLTTGTLYLSPRWKEMLGFGSDELEPKLAAWFDLIHAGDRAGVERALEAHCAGEVAVFECEYRCYDKAGAVRWMRSRGKAFRPEPGAPCTRIAGSQTDVTESKAFDPLTLLPNRVLFRERLESAARNGRNGRPNAVLFMDVDDFKLINDSLGHLTGDQLLKEIAARLKTAAESACAAGLFHGWTLARLGADEFALLAEDPRPGQAREIAAALAGAMREPFTIDRRSLFVTLSIGMAVGDAGEALLRDADTAMYSAKATGSGQFRLFEKHMRQSALERLVIEAELRRALEQGELELYYQPKVRLADQRATDFEALIRWNHPTRGLLGPRHFIPVAEESELIERIGVWVIRQACLQSAVWRGKYPGGQFSISVNVSPRQLADRRLLDVIRNGVREAALPRGFLNVEVTESTVMDNPERASEILHELHRMGVGIHVDDFGKGHSSLHCLRRYPFDTLKIDRSFVSSADEDAGSAEIVRAIVALANALGLAVVAEGLERIEQVQRTIALGCTYGQGYYFGRPVPAREADTLLARQFEEGSTVKTELAALQQALSAGEENEAAKE